MGAFFTAVHVHRADPRALVTALSAEAVEQGFEPCESGADREVVVAGSEDGWVSIFDQATESQDEQQLDALARLASRASGRMAVSVLVHDSDILKLGLYRSGAPVDQFDSHPGYFGERVSAARRKALRGKPEAWLPVLSAEDRLEALRTALRADKLFAEETLREVARLLDLPAARALGGHRSLTDEALVSQPQVQRLRFRARVRPAWEQLATGPTRLDPPPPFVQSLELAPGDELRLGATTVNRGGSSRGLDLIVFGSALSFVEVESFELLLGNPRTSKHRILAARRGQAASGEPLIVCSVDDAALPPGRAVPIHQLMAAGASPHDTLTMLDAQFDSQVHVNVVGQVRTTGQGELHVGFVPHEHREGETTSSWELRASAPLFRPLRAAPDVPSRLLRPLTDGHQLFALIMYARRDARAVAHAEETLRELLALRAPPQLCYGIHPADPTRRPGSGQAKGARFLEGKTGRMIREAMITDRVVNVASGPAFGVPLQTSGAPVPPGLGFSYGSTLLPHEGLEETAGLRLWADLEERSSAEFERAFGRLVDEAMRQGALQAAMGLGTCAPSLGIEHSAYETACGIDQGLVTCTRDWCTRRLRMTGNRATWLGPELARHLEGSPPPGVDLAPVGDAVRLSLVSRSDDTWRALEGWLAPLLPTAQEVNELSQAHYAGLRASR